MPRKRLLWILSISAMLGVAISFGLCIQDDTFISLRYARNLAEGHGLVFNPGEPVEGYTNFLWTLLQTPLFLLDLNPLLFTPLMGIAATAGALAVTWRFKVDGGQIGWVAPFFVALNLGLSMEAVQGLETGLFALLVGLALALRAREEPGDSWPWSGLVAGLAALTRPEGILLFVLLEGWGMVYDRGWRHRVRAWALFSMCVLPHMLFRVLYYGDIVPNTFHAKVGHTADQAVRGVVYVAEFALANATLALAAVFGAGVMLKRRADRLSVLLPGLLLPWLLYVIYVGGDFKPTWRFMMPMLLPMVWAAGGGLAALPGVASKRGAWAWTLVVALGLGVDTARNYPAFADEAETRLQAMEDHLLAAEFLRSAYPPTSVLAIHSAGAVPYASGFYTIDMWGLSDPIIARSDVQDMGQGVAGHEKTDYEYVFSREPDIYLPQHSFLSDEPMRLPVPTAFPKDFESTYTQYSVPYKGRWVNVFQRNEAE